jgi:tRNA nucleotidyltransferase/poly(A) polymerase
MSDLTPRDPRRPLIWPDAMQDLQAVLAGSQKTVFIVGGAVRDAYLHRPIQDIDLAVAKDASSTARQVANALQGDFFVLDDERDVGRALVKTPRGRLIIDVTRFRGEDLFADLVDRDFTINAMAVDSRDLDRIVDPLDGQHDLEVKLLRRCSPHAIASDPIRALRAVRQSVQFGLRIEAETLRDVRANAARLTGTSPERVRDEFFKLLSLPNPATALRIADATGLLKVIIPEIEPLHDLPQEPPHVFDAWRHTLAVIEYLTHIAEAISYARTDCTAATFAVGMVVIQLDRYRAQLNQHLNKQWPNERSHLALLALAALLHDTGACVVKNPLENRVREFYSREEASAHSAGVRAEALRLSKAEKDWLVEIVKSQNQPVLRQENVSRRDIYRFWNRLNAAGVDVCLLSLADHLGTVGVELDQDNWLSHIDRVRLLLEACYEHYDEWIAPRQLVDGNQLIKTLGLRQGPVVGEILEAIREAQASGEIKSVEEALDLARQHLNHHK